jgi:hypothetical protein
MYRTILYEVHLADLGVVLFVMLQTDLYNGIV